MKRLLLFQFLFLSVYCKKFKIPDAETEKTPEYWQNKGKEDLNEALRRVINDRVAKNIIIFIGDGLGVTATTAGRIYKGQLKGSSGEEAKLSWEEFPDVALLKTYCLDRQVPDSASTATAFFTGSKANYKTLGLSGTVKENECSKSTQTSNWVHSVLTWAQNKNKDTGFLSTTRITHATPAALYSHSPQRNLECDSQVNKNDTYIGCIDIARQMVEQKPGMTTNVIMGGGRNPMGATIKETDGKKPCLRNDSRNLVEEWLSHKQDIKKSYTYATNNEQLRKIDPTKMDYIMGLFAGNHLPYEIYRDDSNEGTPSLREMTDIALKRLKRSSNGYFLMVEGGRIDHALHYSRPKLFLEEIIAFDAAIEVALQHADDDTLVIVMADHSHVVTINGYPDRGNDILGKTTYKDVLDGMPYPTIMFGNGYGFGFGNFTWNGTHAFRPNLTDVDTTTKDFVSPAAVPMKNGSETHGGEDIALFAKGPMSHLFYKIHEQSYVATVMAYAACIGPFDNDDCRSTRGPSEQGGAPTLCSSRLTSVISIFVMLRYILL